MTHDKKLPIVKRSFSPVSLKDADRFAQLEKTLELVIMQDGVGYLPECLVDNHETDQSDQTVSTAIRITTPNDGKGGQRRAKNARTPDHRLWIFGLRLSMSYV